MKMKYIEGGTFTMGATEKYKCAHQVQLSDFYISETQVTQGIWEVVMGSNPSHFKDNSQCPVNLVSWEDIQEFLKKLNTMTGKNYRLPTEAEWEYAARGGQKAKPTKYAGSDELDEVGWYEDNSGGKIHPIAQKLPNELGLYDMNGNVWEWCQDRYSSKYYVQCEIEGVVVDPLGPDTGLHRVLRGGNYRDVPQYCCVAERSSCEPTYRSHDFGFRVALDV